MRRRNQLPLARHTSPEIANFSRYEGNAAEAELYAIKDGVVASRTAHYGAQFPKGLTPFAGEEAKKQLQEKQIPCELNEDGSITFANGYRAMLVGIRSPKTKSTLGTKAATAIASALVVSPVVAIGLQSQELQFLLKHPELVTNLEEFSYLLELKAALISGTEESAVEQWEKPNDPILVLGERTIAKTNDFPQDIYAFYSMTPQGKIDVYLSTKPDMDQQINAKDFIKVERGKITNQKALMQYLQISGEEKQLLTQLNAKSLQQVIGNFYIVKSIEKAEIPEPTTEFELVRQETITTPEVTFDQQSCQEVNTPEACDAILADLAAYAENYVEQADLKPVDEKIAKEQPSPNEQTPKDHEKPKNPIKLHLTVFGTYETDAGKMLLGQNFYRIEASDACNTPEPVKQAVKNMGIAAGDKIDVSVYNLRPIQNGEHIYYLACIEDAKQVEDIIKSPGAQNKAAWKQQILPNYRMQERLRTIEGNVLAVEERADVDAIFLIVQADINGDIKPEVVAVAYGTLFGDSKQEVQSYTNIPTGTRVEIEMTKSVFLDDALIENPPDHPVDDVVMGTKKPEQVVVPGNLI